MINLLKRFTLSMLLVSAGGAHADAFVVEAEIQNVVAGAGVIRAELHDSAATYLSEEDARAFRSLVEPVTGSRVLLRFTGVPPGRYAISMYQDLHSNAKLDSNFLRIQKNRMVSRTTYRPGLGHRVLNSLPLW